MDNPALTVPASEALEYRFNTNNNAVREGHGSNAIASQEGGKDLEKGKKNLTKYEQGWRRIVRNFSPSWYIRSPSSIRHGAMLTISGSPRQWGQ